MNLIKKNILAVAVSVLLVGTGFGLGVWIGQDYICDWNIYEAGLVPDPGDLLSDTPDVDIPGF